MAWLCDFIKIVLMLSGFTQNLCGVSDKASAPLLSTPLSANLPHSPVPVVKDLPLSSLPVVGDSPLLKSDEAATTHVPDATETTSVTDTSIIMTSTTDDTTTADATTEVPTTAASLLSGLLPADGILPSIIPAKSTPLAAAGLDINNKKTANVPIPVKIPDLTPLQRFVQALLKLKVDKIGDGYDKKTQDLILRNFGSNSVAKHYNTTQFVQHCARRIEEYTVKTSDGYFLKLFRIPGAGSPVLFMHGLLSSPDDWLTLGCKKSAPYMAAAAGHDVWLGSARGNKYSQRHETLDPADDKFWDFSWHEIGVTDLPTIIDFILIYTNRPKLSYVGHSQGTTSVFVLLSEKPEYNDKIHLVVALSPVVWMGDLFNPLLQVLSQFTDDTEVLTQAIGMGQFALSGEYAAVMRTFICGTSPTAAAVCDPVLSSMYGFSPEYKNFKFLPVQTSHILTSSASKQAIHYMQEIRSGKFQKYDYGAEQNQLVYGASEPPEYQVERVTVPTALFYSTNDWMAAVSDVQRLEASLPNVVYSEQIPPAYSHVDFLWAKNADQYVYSTMLNLLQQFAVEEDYPY